MDSHEIPMLLAAAREGDEHAARMLYDWYSPRLLAMIAGRLSSKLRRRFEPTDVLQSAMGTFFVRLRQGQFECEAAGDLWNLLTAITIRKVCGQVDRHTAGRRSVDAEQSGRSDDSQNESPFEAFDREPTAAEIAAAAEMLDRMMKPLTNEQRDIVQMRLERYTYAEISERLHCSEAVARHLIRKVMRTLEADGD
jgi:RNA polymerase sigma-70 factor (ECF subfamily)